LTVAVAIPIAIAIAIAAGIILAFCESTVRRTW
jgi:predicted benzoate:H+ symporter BenE